MVFVEVYRLKSPTPLHCFGWLDRNEGSLWSYCHKDSRFYRNDEYFDTVGVKKEYMMVEVSGLSFVEYVQSDHAHPWSPGPENHSYRGVGLIMLNFRRELKR